MTVSQTEFVKNYINLISQVDKNDLGKVIVRTFFLYLLYTKFDNK